MDSRLGKQLLEQAEREAIKKDYDSIFLATNELMHENREIYLHLGYVVYDHRVVDGYPRVFFRKNLKLESNQGTVETH